MERHNENLNSEIIENRKSHGIETPNETNNEVLITSENDNFTNHSEFLFGKKSVKLAIDIPRNISENLNDFEDIEDNKSRIPSNLADNYSNKNMNVENNNIRSVTNKDNINSNNSFFDFEATDFDANIGAEANQNSGFIKINNNNNNDIINSSDNFDENKFIFEEDHNTSNRSNNNKQENQSEGFVNNNTNQKSLLILTRENKEKSELIFESPKFKTNKIKINVGKENINYEKCEGNRTTDLNKVSAAENQKLNAKQYEKLDSEETKNEVFIYETYRKQPDLDIVTIETDYNRDEKTNPNHFGTESVRNSSLFLTEKQLNNQLHMENESHVIYEENYEVEMIQSSMKNVASTIEDRNNNKNSFVKKTLTNNNNNNFQNKKINVNSAAAVAANDPEVNTEYFNTNDIQNFCFDTNIKTNQEQIVNNNVFLIRPNLNQENDFIYNTLSSSRGTEANKHLNDYDGNFTTHDTNLMIINHVSETVNNNNHNSNLDNKMNLEANKDGSNKFNMAADNKKFIKDEDFIDKKEELIKQVIIEDKKSS